MKDEQSILVSVVVPVYNSEDTIASCIESILSQTFTALELIVVDDGSKDDSGQISDSYAAKDSRVRVIHQENKGRTEARHVGVVHSRGEWVTFVDSDDKLPSYALETLYTHVSPEVDIVLGCGAALPKSEQRDTIPMSHFRHLAVRAEGTIGVPWGSLYRRNVLNDYLFDLPRDLMMGEDYIFWLRLVFTTYKPVNVEYECVYDKGDDHTSNNFVWTAAYAQRIQDYRLLSIPRDQHRSFADDMLADRLANLWAVAAWSPRREWGRSKFYLDIVNDMKQRDMSFSLKQRIYLALPTRLLRRGWGLVSTLVNYILGKI